MIPKPKAALDYGNEPQLCEWVPPSHGKGEQYVSLKTADARGQNSYIPTGDLPVGSADGKSFPQKCSFYGPWKKSKIQVGGKGYKVFQVMGTVWSTWSGMERQEQADYFPTEQPVH